MTVSGGDGIEVTKSGCNYRVELSGDQDPPGPTVDIQLLCDITFDVVCGSGGITIIPHPKYTTLTLPAAIVLGLASDCGTTGSGGTGGQTSLPICGETTIDIYALACPASCDSVHIVIMQGETEVANQTYSPQGSNIYPVILSGPIEEGLTYDVTVTCLEGTEEIQTQELTIACTPPNGTTILAFRVTDVICNNNPGATYDQYNVYVDSLPPGAATMSWVTTGNGLNITHGPVTAHAGDAGACVIYRPNKLETGVTYTCTMYVYDSAGNVISSVTASVLGCAV